LRLGRAAKAQLVELISRAAPLRGEFFRSVAFRHFHPDDVVSGEGTRLNGGRFVPLGVAAVYASFDEQTALREVTARRSLLHGRSRVEFRDYPRMIYVLRIATQRNLDLSIPLGLSCGRCSLTRFGQMNTKLRRRLPNSGSVPESKASCSLRPLDPVEMS
jgi:RES domain